MNWMRIIYDYLLGHEQCVPHHTLPKIWSKLMDRNYRLMVINYLCKHFISPLLLFLPSLSLYVQCLHMMYDEFLILNWFQDITTYQGEGLRYHLLKDHKIYISSFVINLDHRVTIIRGIVFKIKTDSSKR